MKGAKNPIPARKIPAGEVRAEGLKAFLQGRVKELAAKVDREQEPQYFRARDAENVLLARAH